MSTDEKKTVKVSIETWELLNLIKTRKKLKSMDEVIDYLLDKKDLDPKEIKTMFKKIDNL